MGMTQASDNCRFGHHEWPIADRRSIRRVELVVTAETSGPASGSVEFDSSERPRRVVPLALGLTLAILGVVHSTSILLTVIDPDGADLSGLQMVGPAIARQAVR